MWPVARVRRETVSRLERGGLGRVRWDTFRAVTATLGIRVDVRLRWQGGDLDRVINAAHAELHESLIRHLSTRSGWSWRPEVSYSIYGERGVIDNLAWHEETRSLLIIELKTELLDRRIWLRRWVDEFDSAVRSRGSSGGTHPP